MEADTPSSLTAPIVAEITPLMVEAGALRIVDATSYERGAAILWEVKTKRDRIAGVLDPHIARAFATHKGLVAEKKLAEQPLLAIESAVKTAMGVYDQAQESKRRVEEARLREEARKDAEARQLAEAAALEREAAATGDPMLLAEAQRLVEMPVATPAVFVAPTTPKVAGIVHRENWSARVVSLPALIAFVAAHPQHVNLLQPNQAALNTLARAMKQNLRVDGVQAVMTPGVAVGR